MAYVVLAGETPSHLRLESVVCGVPVLVVLVRRLISPTSLCTHLVDMLVVIDLTYLDLW